MPGAPPRPQNGTMVIKHHNDVIMVLYQNKYKMHQKTNSKIDEIDETKLVVVDVVYFKIKFIKKMT